MFQHFMDEFEDMRDRRSRELFHGRGTSSVSFLSQFQVLEGQLGMNG